MILLFGVQCRGIKKEPPVVRAALCTYLGVVLLYSHSCHPNRKLILNNKDRKEDDNYDGEKRYIHWLKVFRPIIGRNENPSRGKILYLTHKFKIGMASFFRLN